LAAADDVLSNTGTVAELRQAVDRLHEKYLRLAQTSSSRRDFT
jgi:dephospho-CoA kinase